MSTDFNCGEISADEKGDALVVSNEDYLTMADNKGRSNVGDELKEISLNEKDVVTQSSIKESTGLVSSQNEGKKKKKKKASKGTESALNDAKGEEVKIEDHGPSGGTIYWKIIKQTNKQTRQTKMNKIKKLFYKSKLSLYSCSIENVSRAF